MKRIKLFFLTILLFFPIMIGISAKADENKIEFNAKIGRLFIPMSYTSDGVLTIGKIDYSYDGEDKYDSWIDEITTGYHYYDSKQQKEVYDTVDNNSKVYFPSEDKYYKAEDGVEHIKELLGNYDVKRIELGEDVTDDFISEISYISTDNFSNKFNMAALATIYNKYIYTPLRNAEYINVSAIYPFFSEATHTLGYPASVQGKSNKSVTVEAGPIRLIKFNFNVYNADVFNARFTGTATMYSQPRYMYANVDKLRVITNGGTCSGAVNYKKYPRLITVHLVDSKGNGTKDIDADLGYSMEKNPELDLYGKPLSNPYTTYTIKNVPHADYYDFKEWTLKGIEPFTTQAEYTAEAVYTPKNYEINIGCDKPDSVNPNGKIINWNIEDGEVTLKDATADGYIFDGWYDVNTNERVLSINKNTVDPSLSQIFIISKFYAKTVKIRFDAENNKVYDAITLQYDDKIPVLPVPTKEGYEFKGWFNGESEVKAGQLCKFDTTVILKAKWEEKSSEESSSQTDDTTEEKTEDKEKDTTEEKTDPKKTDDKKPTDKDVIDSDVVIDDDSDEATNPDSKYETSKDSDITADELKEKITSSDKLTADEKVIISKLINKSTTRDETVYIKEMLKSINRNKYLSAKAKKIVKISINSIKKAAKKYKIQNLKVTSSKRKRIKLTWERVSGVKNYQIQVSTKKSFNKKKTFTFNARIPNFTIKGLKTKKKYYVRMRTVRKISHNVTVYGKWSSVKKIKTK